MTILNTQRLLGAAVCVLLLAFTLAGAAAAPLESGLRTILSSAPRDSVITVLVAPARSFDLSDLDNQLRLAGANRKLRHHRVVEALKLETSRSQASLVKFLNTERSNGKVKSYHPFWITNIVAVTTTASRVAELAARPDIGRVLENRVITLSGGKVKQGGKAKTASAGETLLADSDKIFNWALANMNVRPLWQRGLTGRGILVGNIDSGVDGNHPALASKWRGAHGATATESWYDALNGSSFPFDDHTGTHGTKTMGCMVAQSGADTVGVLPDAQWIAAKAFTDNQGSSVQVIDCMEWMADPDLDPTTVDDVPDILNLSFGDNSTHSCVDIYWDALNNLKALGVVPICASGNIPDHGEKVAAPGNSSDFFAVTAVDSLNQYKNHSMPGPSTCDPNAIKPDIVAPGHRVITAKGTEYTSSLYSSDSGSSFACPLAAGVAALVRQANPDLSPDEIYEVLRGSATDLGVAGPDTLFGYGAINADSAVALAGSPSRPWLAITNIELNAGTDELVSPGEDISVALTVVNNGLSASSVTATVTSNQGDVTVAPGELNFGAVPTGGTASNSSDPFALSFSQSIGQQEIRTFNVVLTMDDQTQTQTQILAFAVAVGGEPPTAVESYASHDANNAGLTVTNFGKIGVSSNDGGGFNFPRLSTLSNDHLFRGALLIGNGPLAISDASYSEIAFELHPTGVNHDFTVVEGGNLDIFQPGDFANQEITGSFSDSASDAPLGLVINQRSYAWSGEADQDYVVLEYRLSSTSDTVLDEMYFAEHMDWDVGKTSDNDIAAFEDSLALAYMFDAQSPYYVGQVLLSQAVGGHGEFSYNSVIYDGFTGQEKFSAMSISSGDTVITLPDDYSQLLSAGPFVLKPQKEITIAFAIVGGEGLEDLRANAAAARAKWAEVAAAKQLDITAPSMTVQPLRNQAPQMQNYRLDMTATDSASSVEQVRVFWREGGEQPSAWVSVDAVISEGGYAAILPGRTEGTRVQYYVRALDTQGNQALQPAGAPDLLYSFYVGDTTRPVFADAGVSVISDGSGMLLSATVSDSDLGMVTAILPGVEPPDTLQMLPDEQSGRYTVVLTGLEPSSEVSYYFEATDTLGNYARYPATAPDELLELVFSPVLAGDGDLNGKVDIFDVLAVLGVISGRVEPSASEFAAMDLDRNDKINIFDLLEVLKLLRQ